jgi:hypothetical protein
MEGEPPSSPSCRHDIVKAIKPINTIIKTVLFMPHPFQMEFFVTRSNRRKETGTIAGILIPCFSTSPPTVCGIG